MKKFNQISNYWHVEAFILMPWLVWFSFKFYELVGYLEILAVTL